MLKISPIDCPGVNCDFNISNDWILPSLIVNLKDFLKTFCSTFKPFLRIRGIWYPIQKKTPENKLENIHYIKI